eukprot:c5559_g1_i1.p1 GENE.c5559_g1_i1~~c5559_g1_i1.p1  ORF type:complete len:322 (+),score=53.39 c5559_g1_i1:30-968(+)
MQDYTVLAAKPFEFLALALEAHDPKRFQFYRIQWSKFPDSDMDDIEIGGFTPQNRIKNTHVLFLASFHSNDAILSQFHVLITLLESFISGLTIVLPFFPTGTMERITREGQVATCNTIARMFSNLPSSGKPNRVMIYDIHALQSRFYLYGNSLASLHTTIPLLLRELGPPGNKIDAIVFPDEGAHKRFKEEFRGFPTVVCAKVRDGDIRKVTIQEGHVEGLRTLIVDDLVRSGGTLYECAKALKDRGALTVSAFCAHANFKEVSWRRFCEGGDRAVFEVFYVTNSAPTTTDQLVGVKPFQVLDLLPQILEDL